MPLHKETKQNHLFWIIFIILFTLQTFSLAETFKIVF